MCRKAFSTQQDLPLRFRRTQDQHPTSIQAQNNLYFIYMLSSGEAGALLEESGSLEIRHKSENLCSKDKNEETEVYLGREVKLSSLCIRSVGKVRVLPFS